MARAAQLAGKIPTNNTNININTNKPENIEKEVNVNFYSPSYPN